MTGTAGDTSTRNRPDLWFLVKFPLFIRRTSEWGNRTGDHGHPTGPGPRPALPTTSFSTVAPRSTFTVRQHRKALRTGYYFRPAVIRPALSGSGNSPYTDNRSPAQTAALCESLRLFRMKSAYQM
jgi:hypothetical protein